MNWVSRVPVIFFFGGGFRFDFLRPMPVGGRTYGVGGQKSATHGTHESLQMLLEAGQEAGLAGVW